MPSAPDTRLCVSCSPPTGAPRRHGAETENAEPGDGGLSLGGCAPLECLHMRPFDGVDTRKARGGMCDAARDNIDACPASDGRRRRDGERETAPLCDGLASRGPAYLMLRCMSSGVQVKVPTVPLQTPPWTPLPPARTISGAQGRSTTRHPPCTSHPRHSRLDLAHPAATELHYSMCVRTAAGSVIIDPGGTLTNEVKPAPRPSISA